MDDHTFTFSWEVKNFSLCAKGIGCAIKCNRFATGTLHEPVCMALFSPRDSADPDFISLLLSRVDMIPVKLEVRVTFQLVAPDGTPGNRVHLTEKVRRHGTFSVTKFASRKEVEERYLHNDTLRIQCVFRKKKELTIETLFARTADDVRKICKEWPLQTFSQRMKGEVLDESVRMKDGNKSVFDVCRFFDGELLFDVRLSIEGSPGQEVVIIEFIRRCNPPMKPLCLDTLITVLDAQGIESEIWKQDQHVFHMRSPEEVWQFPTFISETSLLRQKNMYLSNDILTLKCDITVTSGTMASEIQKFHHYVEFESTKSFDQLTEDMTDLYKSKRFADVKLRASGETVPAHKIVLQSRSEKFTEMLNDDERIYVLDVPDVDMITLKRMLKYMYTDEIDDFEYDDVVLAYIAAHKYRIESLKCKYSFLLQSYLNGSNACRICMLAADSSDQDLKNCAVDFIKKYGGLGLSD